MNDNRRSLRQPHNTAAEPPIARLAEAMASPSGFVEAQEARGQTSFVNSDTLPTDIPQDAKQKLEAAGIRFLGLVEGDPMFQYVDLPKGWKKIPTDHSMWSNLVDETGTVRAQIFYKAAFYDRSAFLRLA